MLQEEENKPQQALADTFLFSVQNLSAHFFESYLFSVCVTQ